MNSSIVAQITTLKESSLGRHKTGCSQCQALLSGEIKKNISKCRLMNFPSKLCVKHDKKIGANKVNQCWMVNDLMILLQDMADRWYC